MVEFRDVVKKYAGTDEALGVPAGAVGGIPVVTPDDLGPAAAMTPAEVVTDEDAQAALSGAFVPKPATGPSATTDQALVSVGGTPTWVPRPLYGPLSVSSWGLPTPGVYGGSSGNQTISTNPERVRFVGLPITNRRARTRCGVMVATPSAGGLAQLGLYRLTDPWGDSLAMELVQDFGTIALDVSGVVEAVVESFTPTPGLYAIGCVGLNSEAGSASLIRCGGPGRMWEVFHHSAPTGRDYAPYKPVSLGDGLPATTTSAGMTIESGGSPYSWLR